MEVIEDKLVETLTMIEFYIPDGEIVEDYDVSPPGQSDPHFMAQKCYLQTWRSMRVCCVPVHSAAMAYPPGVYGLDGQSLRVDGLGTPVINRYSLRLTFVRDLPDGWIEPVLGKDDDVFTPASDTKILQR